MNFVNNEDHILVQRFIERRDETSFCSLYRLYTPRIFGLAVRLTGCKNDAEELTQEAWVRCVRNLDGFGARSKFSTWLSGILINCFRETIRNKARIQQFENDANQYTAEIINVFPSDWHWDGLDLDNALSQLAPGYREIVVLHDLFGYTHREIAEITGITEGTSKSQLTRGRSILRDLLMAESTGGKEAHHE